MSDQREELRNCPFCGCTAYLTANGMGDYFVICGDGDEEGDSHGCRASSSDMNCETIEGAIARWNRRVESDCTGKVLLDAETVERIRRALSRAEQLASIAYDWDLGTDGKVEIDGAWIGTTELRSEFLRTLAAIPAAHSPKEVQGAK